MKFSDTYIEKTNAMLNRIITQIGYIALYDIAKKQGIDIIYGKNIKPNTYYYLRFKNPLFHAVSKSNKKKRTVLPNGKVEWGFYEIDPNAEEYIECIGYSDENNTIWLVGKNNIYLTAKSGWNYIYNNPDITYYRVNTVKRIKQFSHRYLDLTYDKTYYNKEIEQTPTIGFTSNIKFDNGLCGYNSDKKPEFMELIIELTNIKDIFAQYTQEKEEEQRKQAEYKKHQEEQEKLIEYIKQNYTDIGYSAPSTAFEEEIDMSIYNEVKNDPNSGGWKEVNVYHETYRNNRGSCGRSLIYNDKYKVYYTSIYDTSD